LSSNAPLAPIILHFLEIVFVCKVQQVYTITEAGPASISYPGDHMAPDTGGAPVLSREIKLVDSGKFTCRDEQPSGEICLRGPSVAKGYHGGDYELVDDGGWFHTGDIGEWRGNGALAVVDRIDSIATLSTGATVCLERLEAVYSRSQFVSQIYVHGDDSEPCLVAVVMVHATVMTSFASARNVRDQFRDPSDAGALCEDDKIKNIIVSDLRKLAKANGLKNSDLVRGVYLDMGAWTAEHNYASPMLKLKRAEVQRANGNHITNIFDSLKAEAKAAIQAERDGGGRGRKGNDEEDEEDEED